MSEYINTGKRSLDNSLIGIACLLFGAFLAYLPMLYYLLQDWLCIILFEKKSDKFEPEKVDPSVYSLDKIVKYKYCFKVESNDNYPGDTKSSWISIFCDDIAMYIGTTYGDFCSANSSEMIYSKTTKKLTFNMDIDSNLPNMPIHRYVKNYRYEYIILYKNVLYCNDLNEFESFIAQFDKSPNNNESRPTEKFIYEVNGNGCLVNKGKVNTRKTFERLHFDGKHEIVSLLDQFMSNTLYPPTTSLDNKLGFLLYGPPGTGKTGSCSAIANKLNRHILLLNSLLALPRDKVLDVIKTVQTTHVIVLDEFDQILCNKTVPFDFNTAIIKAATQAEKDELKKQQVKETQKGMTDEEFMLKLLDSFGDDNGRIIVATTNNPEKINIRYLRPGRFDGIFLIGYCSMQTFHEIVIDFHGKDQSEIFMEENKEKIEMILQLNITPLVAMHAMAKYRDNFAMALNSLLLRKKEEYYGFDPKPSLAITNCEANVDIDTLKSTDVQL